MRVCPFKKCWILRDPRIQPKDVSCTFLSLTFLRTTKEVFMWTQNMWGEVLIFSASARECFLYSGPRLSWTNFMDISSCWQMDFVSPQGCSFTVAVALWGFWFLKEISVLIQPSPPFPPIPGRLLEPKLLIDQQTPPGQDFGSSFISSWGVDVLACEFSSALNGWCAIFPPAFLVGLYKKLGKKSLSRIASEKVHSLHLWCNCNASSSHHLSLVL